jgi:hypothetical protein
MKSTDQQINRSTLSCFLLLNTLFLAGCDTQTFAVSTVANSTVANTPVTLSEEVLLDEGIVFAKSPSYLCLPFAKVGLYPFASVVCLHSCNWRRFLPSQLLHAETLVDKSHAGTMVDHFYAEGGDASDKQKIALRATHCEMTERLDRKAIAFQRESTFPTAARPCGVLALGFSTR